MAQGQVVDPRRQEFIVLLVIAGGLIVIILSIILGLFLTPRSLPNWAENVLVGIASVTGLRLGDCLSALVQLASGRQVARLGEHLAQTGPAQDAGPTPKDAAEAADQVAGAAEKKADEIKGGEEPPLQWKGKDV